MTSLVGAISTRVIFMGDTAGVPVRWASTLEWTVNGSEPLSDVQVETVISNLVSFYGGLLLSPFWIERVDISTAVPDGKPYNPETFISRSVMLHGGRTVPDGVIDVLPLSNVLLLKKTVWSGREGSMLLRGALREADIQSEPLTGAISLVNRALFTSLVNTGWADYIATMQDFLVPALVNLTPDGSYSWRPVTGLTVKTVTNKKLNNKYFNRTATPIAEAGLLEKAFSSDELRAIVQKLVVDGLVLAAG